MALGGPQNGDEQEGEGGGGIFADINITPLTDIFLVLLIIFMVTTTAIHEASSDKGGFKVNLPKGSKGDVGEVPRDLVVAVLADGRAAPPRRVGSSSVTISRYSSVRSRSWRVSFCTWVLTTL